MVRFRYSYPLLRVNKISTCVQIWTANMLIRWLRCD